MKEVIGMRPFPRLTEGSGRGSGADSHCRAPDPHFLQLRVQTAPRNTCSHPVSSQYTVCFGKPGHVQREIDVGRDQRAGPEERELCV